jgi:hypothetical protein
MAVRSAGWPYNYQGQRCGRPHVASWAETGLTLAAELLSGDVDPRPGSAGLLRRALASLPRGGTVNFTLIMIYLAKANTGCGPFDEARPPHLCLL